MTTEDDVLAEWRSRRFVLLSPDLLDNGHTATVLLSDFPFWANAVDELLAWCEVRNATVRGMTVEFGDDLTLTEFILRWA